MGAWNAEQKRKWIFANVKMICDNIPENDLTIMGVDLATKKCGVVIVNSSMDVIASRVFGKDSRFSHWEKVKELASNFSELINDHKPDLVAFESVRSMRNFTGLRAMLLALSSFYSAMASIDYDHPSKDFEIPVMMPFVPSQLKKIATGNGRAEKEEVISFCQTMGFDPKDDNEADAYAAAYSSLLMTRYAYKFREEVSLDEFDNAMIRDFLKKFEVPDVEDYQMETIQTYLENDTFMKEVAKRRYAKVGKAIRSGEDFIHIK